MVQLGREVPELPGELLFSDGELRVLATFARSRTLPPPTRLGDAVGLVGRLGGWLGPTRDPPGAQLLWHGYTQLVAMAFAYALVGVQPDQLLCFTYGYPRAAKWRRLKAASMMLVERGSSTPCSGGKARRDEGLRSDAVPVRGPARADGETTPRRSGSCTRWRPEAAGTKPEGLSTLSAAGPGPSGLNGLDASHGCCGQRLQCAPVIVAEHPPAVRRHNDRSFDDEWAAVLLGPFHGEESHDPRHRFGRSLRTEDFVEETGLIARFGRTAARGACRRDRLA